MRDSAKFIALRKVATEWANRVLSRHRSGMFMYPKDRLDANASWSMTDVRERVIAAHQIGYDVIIREYNGDLHIEYQAKVPSRPNEF